MLPKNSVEYRILYVDGRQCGRSKEAVERCHVGKIRWKILSLKCKPRNELQALTVPVCPMASSEHRGMVQRVNTITITAQE